MSSTAPPVRASIKDRAKTPDYTARALDAIVQITAAKDPPQLLERLLRATAAIGASAGLYTAAIPEGNRAQVCLSLFAGHPGYAHAQNDLGSLLSHPWFRYACTHSTSGSNRQIRIEEGPDLAAIKLASQYGFRSCFVVPTPAGLGLQRLEMLCLGSEALDDFEGPEASIVRTLARSLAAELHDWLTHHLQQRLRQGAQLAKADVNLLAMEWRGLRTKEISLLTGLSVASVNSRFQRINERLHCASRKASAMQAAAYGLLELP